MKKITKKITIDYWFLKSVHDKPDQFFIRKSSIDTNDNSATPIVEWIIGHEADNKIKVLNYVDDWTSKKLEHEFVAILNVR